jgi:hypothetical protein
MTEAINEREEIALQAMFGRAVAPVADEGFSKGVLGRVRRTIWTRRIVTLSTVAIGLLIAAPVVPQFLLTLSDQLVGLAASVEESGTLGQFQALLPLRETAQAASEEIVQVSNQMSTASWYLKNQAYFLAGLMALVSIVVPRVMGR